MKEKTAGMNTTLELEGLVLDEIKGFNSEILVKEELEKGKGPTFGSYPGSTEMDHGCKTDELGNLELERKIVMGGNFMPTSWKSGTDRWNRREIKLEEVESKVLPVKSDDKIKEFEKIKVSKVDDKSDKKVPLERDIRLTVTEVLDAYYDLDETVEEHFNDAVFGFNEEQENGLEVLLKEVSAECDALVQKLTPKKKESIQEPGGEINVRNNKDEGVKVGMELDSSEKKKKEKTETVPTKHILDNKAQTEGDRETFEERSVEEWREDRYERPLDGDALGHACNSWIRKAIEFRGMVEKKEHKAFGHYKKSTKIEGLTRTYDDRSRAISDGRQYGIGSKKGIEIEKHDNETVDKYLRSVDGGSMEMRYVNGMCNSTHYYQKGLGAEMEAINIGHADKRLGSGPKKGNEVEREDSQNYPKYKIQKSAETIIEKDEIDEDNCSEVEGLKKGFGLDDDGVNGMVVDEKNGICPVKDKKTKLEWNMEPTEGGRPDTKSLEISRPDHRDVDFRLINMEATARDIGVENDKNNGIVVVGYMNGEEEDKKRIVVSNNIRYQMSDKEIDDLSESIEEFQDIECADKWWSSSVAKLAEIVNIREDGKRIDNKVNTPLFDPGGSVLPKMKKTKQESKINSYLVPATYLLQHCPYLCVEA
ncbi:hypothetical protein F8M41_001149 [Gigaspora margarita]|uniref:Uncharacterized protein n=1 Tax=Gigaspora margarita TaxID=4874 RepID=A0A8H3XGV2_GIGMA|nr:hypothetical protein F8M41_001149 [Gigaspora margarita]